MTYIFLVAGKGSRLAPLTLSYPKSLYKLDESTCLIQRMVRNIRTTDPAAEIVVVVGFKAHRIREELSDVIFVDNPFYAVTNSIASLWFAREYLLRNQVTIINGDIVMSTPLINDVLCKPTEKPIVLLDSSIKRNGDYNVQVENDAVLVMSKELEEYYGEYAGVTKLDAASARLLRNEVELMVSENMYDQWYENALVQMIFRQNFDLYFRDICSYSWTEVDCVSDLLLAKRIHAQADKA